MHLKRILTIGMSLAGLMVVGLIFAFSALAQPTAERTVQMKGYMPDVPMAVSIEVTRSEWVEVIVVEKTPTGWPISNVNYPNAVAVKEDVITWNLPAFAGKRRLTYTITPPATATWEAVFAGKVGDREIGGTTRVIRVEPEPIGIFQNHINLGFNTSSTAEYNSQTGIYSIDTHLGSGVVNVICGPFLYSKAFGDCSIEAQCEAKHPDDDPYYHTAGIIIFNSLNALSCSCIAMETKGVGSLQRWVFEATQSTLDYANEFGSRTLSEGRMRIERQGNVFNCYNFNPQLQQWILVDTRKKAFKDPIYIGLFTVCGNKSYTQGIFKDVKLTLQPSNTSVKDWEIYQ